MLDFTKVLLKRSKHFTSDIAYPLVSRSEYPRDKSFSTDNGFIFKKINKNLKRKEKKKSHEPFQSYLLTGQA